MFASQFQHRQKMHHHDRRALRHVKHGTEFDETSRIAQDTQDRSHVFAHRQLFALDGVARV